MSYIDVYFSRVNHLGDSTAERIRNTGIRSFQKWLAESPHTVRNLSVERGIFFDGIILTSKDKEYEKIMFLEVANETKIKVGDIMNWTIDDGSVEKWILIQEEKKTNGTFRSFWIVRCNYLMKWIDNQGHIQQSWAYFVSSLDSKIKGNFRTWHNLITPQPNKYAELLMPRYPIDLATNFIVEKESWTVIEYDHTSVPGIIYLSLTEGKINEIYDDVDNNLADTDKLAVYDLSIPPLTQIFHLGDHINLVYTLTKNGSPCDLQTEFLTSNKKIVREIDGELIAVGRGVVDIIVRLKDYPDIKQTITINIEDAEVEQVFSGYIEGADKIPLARKSTYIFKGTKELDAAIDFQLAETTLASILSTEGNTCIVLANKKNQLGTVVLNATYHGQIFSKEIKVVPLW